MESKCLCVKCGWFGMADEMAVRYLPNPRAPDDVVPEVSCPECGGLGLVDIGGGSENSLVGV